MRTVTLILSGLLLLALCACDATPPLADRPSTALEVTTHHDLSYSESYLLDVVAPNAPGPWPVIVLFHGGDGFKESVFLLGKEVAARGAVVFIPTYPVIRHDEDAPSLLAGLERAACALRYARVHAVDYGGSDSRLLAAGHSLGGNIAAILGLAGDSFSCPCVVSSETSALPDAVISLDGAYDMAYLLSADLQVTELLNSAERASGDAFDYVAVAGRQRDVAFLLYTGEETQLHNYGVRFEAALREEGYDVTLTRIPEFPHSFFSSGYIPEVVDIVADGVWALP